MYTFITRIIGLHKLSRLLGGREGGRETGREKRAVRGGVVPGLSQGLVQGVEAFITPHINTDYTSHGHTGKEGGLQVNDETR